MKKKIYNLLLVIAAIECCQLTIPILAQSVGINTKTPTDTLDIFSQGNNGQTKNLIINNSSNVNLLTLLDNGYMSIGTTVPVVRLDLRGTVGGNNIIGIGTTNLPATTAKSGALKYVADSGNLPYSDGTQWMELEAEKVRNCVIAENSYNLMACPNNATTRLGNWIALYDPTSAFDPTTGIFTAPKTGLYIGLVITLGVMCLSIGLCFF